MAGPGARGRPRADRRAGHRASQGRGPRLGPVRIPTGRDRLGGGGIVPRHRQARWRQRGTPAPGAAEGLGSERPRGTGAGAAGAGGDSGGVQRRAVGRQAGLPRRPDRARGGRRRRAGRTRCRAGSAGPLRPRAHRRVAGVDRRGVVRRARTHRGRFSQLRRGRQWSVGGGTVGGAGLPADAERARDDGAGRRHARPECQYRTVRARRLHRPAGNAEQ